MRGWLIAVKCNFIVYDDDDAMPMELQNKKWMANIIMTNSHWLWWWWWWCCNANVHAVAKQKMNGLVAGRYKVTWAIRSALYANNDDHFDDDDDDDDEIFQPSCFRSKALLSPFITVTVTGIDHLYWKWLSNILLTECCPDQGVDIWEAILEAPRGGPLISPW